MRVLVAGNNARFTQSALLLLIIKNGPDGIVIVETAHACGSVIAPPYRPCPFLRRQRAAVGVLLSQCLRFRRRRLRRPGNALTLRGRLRAQTGQHYLSPGFATGTETSREPATHPARRRRAGHCPGGG